MRSNRNMMAVALAGVVVLLPALALAGEHPQKGQQASATGQATTTVQATKEHPKTEHPKSEHPTKAHATFKPTMTTDDMARAIQSYVDADSKLKGGSFLVWDATTSKTLSLKLAKIHLDKLAKVSDGLYFACCDFTATDGKTYDLDFFMTDGAGKMIQCPPECGFTVRGANDEALVANAMSHAKQHHPEEAATLTRETLLGWAEPDYTAGLTVSEIAVHKENGKPRYGWEEKGGVWMKVATR